ncbi:MAG: PQQ-binding-like beta-propeller repeat protein [Gemmataceae bacterium]|nr:PQQ-binding-like beta-propeller repeat protein [Gemmataceae bacterium]
MIALLLLHAGPFVPEPLPPRALARFGTHRFHHGPNLRAAALSPDGSLAASAGVGVVAWDAATGVRLWEQRLEAHALAFSRDGRTLAVATGEVVSFLQARTGTTRFRVAAQAVRLRFTPDGKRLLACGSEAVAFDPSTGEELRRWKPTGLEKGDLALDAVPSPDGTLLAWRVMRLPDLSKLPPGAVPPPPRRDADLLVMQDAATGKALYRIGTAARDGFGRVAFSPDGRSFLSLDGVRRDSRAGKPLPGPALADLWRFAHSPGGSLVLADSASRLSLLDPRTRKARRLLEGSSYLNSDLLHEGCLSADGSRLLVATDSTLRLFDTRTGKEIGPGNRMRLVPRFSADGRKLHATCDEWRLSWDAETHTLLSSARRQPWEGVCGEQALGHSPDGRVYLWGEGGKAFSHETATGRRLAEMRGATFAHRAILSPDGGRAIVLRNWESATLNDTATGKLLARLDPWRHGGQPVFSPDGKRLAWARNEGAVALYDSSTGKEAGHARPAKLLRQATEYLLCFSGDGERLAVASRVGEGGWSVGVHRCADGAEVARFLLPSSLTPVDLSPDGRLLAASGSDGRCLLAEVATGRVRAEFAGHRGEIHGLAFSPDGRTLATGGIDNTVMLWDLLAPTPPETWWASLGGKGDAVGAIIRAKAVRFLAERLRPVPLVDAARLRRLIAALDADDFEDRQRASRALEEMGELAGPAMKSARKEARDIERRFRLDALLAKLERPLSPAQLRGLRGVEALERIGTPEARAVLARLAKGAPEARVTQEARAALRRWR